MTVIRPKDWRRAAILAFAVLGACSTPPPEAYVTTTAQRGAAVPAGPDASGEPCFAQAGSAPPAGLPVAWSRELFCSGGSQPVARVLQLRGGADPAQLDALARGGVWRTWLEQRVTCDAPVPTTLGNGAPARLLACVRRVGGWPHVAMVAAGRDGPVLADGVATATPVIERLAIGGAGSEAAPLAGRSAALELAARRLAAETFRSSDVARYEELMALGRALNETDNYAGAEEAYRAALVVQERALGRDHPGTVGPLVHLALNLSNQGRQQEADALFARAELVTPRSADLTAAARLDHYRGVAALNAGRQAEAQERLDRAERRYAALVPQSVVDGSGGDFALVVDPTTQSAVIGLAEVRRYRAIAFSRANDAARGEALLNDSRRLLRNAGFEPGALLARSLRTEARTLGKLGRDDAAAARLEAAAQRFAIAAPGERPEAVTLFLAGATRLEAGRRAQALDAFRTGAAILRARQIALPVGLVMPYLDALDAEANASAAQAERLRAEMFAAMQLAQRSNTVRFVQQASARIGTASGDPLVAEAVRRLQDAEQALRDLFAERDAGGVGDVDARIAAAQATRADAENEVAAAAPGYRQLLLSSVEASAVHAVLAPDEAMVVMLLGREHGWVLGLRGGRITASRTALTNAEATRLIRRLLDGIVTGDGQPGRLDPVPAQALHDALLAPLDAVLRDVGTLVVVPDGPLLGLPLETLLTGPADPDRPDAAPWLLRRHAIVHVPSPQTFVTLRGAGAASRAKLPWIGFGDFVPASAAQLQRSFPAQTCRDDARLASGLGALPLTRVEVELARRVTGGRPQDALLGPAFTAEALRSVDLSQYRLVHFATHALLPGELSCLQEPSVVLSTPARAADANAAFLRASDLFAFKLDADLVILSACNTGGPGGAGGGEALSGLARAFFFAGARGLLVTFWPVNDAAAALTVVETLKLQNEGMSSAKALRKAQLAILDGAGAPGSTLPASWAHPFFWAPFALIGDGLRAAAARAS